MMLGNLSVDQIEDRLEVKFSNEVRDFMKNNWQQEANNIQVGKWHCFDIPFRIICGDEKTATKIYSDLQYRANSLKRGLQIGIEQYE